MRRSTPQLLLVAVLVLVLPACARMPSSGPVFESDVPSAAESPPGIYFDPKPPQPGQSPHEIVTNYLEAMQATPIKTSVARQFLTASAQETWSPEESIITYEEAGEPFGQPRVQVELESVNQLDERGAWQQSRAQHTLEFRLVVEDGEWRIDRTPDALVVPQSWFEDWFRRVSLYFFDPTAEILVPEPVFVPEGDQLATALVRGLLHDSSTGSSPVSRSFFPPDLERPLSVPISDAGVADVVLEGEAGEIDETLARRMLTQLTWTLRQEPRIRAVRLTIGGQVVGSGGPAPVNVGADYDPTVVTASNDLFALLDGRLVRGTLGDLQGTRGPLGSARLGVREVGVNITGTRVAGVSGDGSSVLVAPVDDPEGSAVEVLSGADDVLAPSWDFADKMWLVDRARGRARVMLVVGERVRALQVPGLTGRDVQQFLVSRDGSRIVAVVGTRKGDQVRVARVLRDEQGRVLRTTRAETVPLEDASGTQVHDIGWDTPSSLSVLSVITDDLSQVRTISVDGSPGDLAAPGSSRLRGRARQLVSSPVEGTNVYVVAGRSVSDLTVPELTLPPLPQGLTSLTYPG
jgi:hypothetical protein